MRRPNAALRRLPHDPRSGSCLGISRYDHCPCTSCHALGQRGKRYSISQTTRLGPYRVLAASPHPLTFCIVSPAWPSTSALSNSTASPGPVLKRPHKTLIAVPCAPGVTCSQPPLRVSQTQDSPLKQQRPLSQPGCGLCCSSLTNRCFCFWVTQGLPSAWASSRRLKNWALVLPEGMPVLQPVGQLPLSENGKNGFVRHYLAPGLSSIATDGLSLPAQRHLLRNDLRQVRLLQPMLLRIELVHLARPVHAAELRPAHGAERRFLVVVVRQRLIMHPPRRIRIERQRKLLVPVKRIPRMRDRIIPIPRARPMPRHIRRMSSNLVRDNPVLHVLLVRQPQVLLRRHVAEHRRAMPPDHRRANRRS